jgi:hypothetical protein
MYLISLMSLFSDMVPRALSKKADGVSLTVIQFLGKRTDIDRNNPRVLRKRLHHLVSKSRACTCNDNHLFLFRAKLPLLAIASETPVIERKPVEGVVDATDHSKRCEHFENGNQGCHSCNSVVCEEVIAKRGKDTVADVRRAAGEDVKETACEDWFRGCPCYCAEDSRCHLAWICTVYCPLLVLYHGGRMRSGTGRQGIGMSCSDIFRMRK